MTYVISDIHGEYNQLVELLDKIGFSDADTLYVLGDCVDRGPDPMLVLKFMMRKPNVIPIAGNHDLMALKCLNFYTTEITAENVDSISSELIEELQIWDMNHNQPTIEGFKALSPEERADVLEYISDFSAYEEVSAGGKDYLLVHGGLGNFDPGRPLDEYFIEELVWSRADYDTVYFDDVYTVTGHTPTQVIDGNPRPGYIFRKNNHIAIDCGASYPGGRLAALCLDTGEEFYSSGKK